ncbi:MAG TPA: hypothetical protein VH572_05045 [Gaiella sp.]|jgi:hypothetical protein
MTMFGDRELDRAPFPGHSESSTTERGWTQDDGLAQLLDPPPVPGSGSTAQPAHDLHTQETRRVVMRVNGAEDVELGRVEGREAAVDLAREMIRAIEAAQARGEWPQVEDRFIRPGAIVSVDVQRAEQ